MSYWKWKRQGAEYFNHFNFRIQFSYGSCLSPIYCIKDVQKMDIKLFFYYLEGFVVLFQGFASIIFILQHFLPFTFVGLRPYYRITCVTLIIIRKKKVDSLDWRLSFFKKDYNVIPNGINVWKRERLEGRIYQIQSRGGPNFFSAGRHNFFKENYINFTT